MSFAGKVQLMSTVIFGISAYWMSVFCLPSSVVLRFTIPLGGDTANKRKFHNIAWGDICKTKRVGGLGFKDGNLWNKVSADRFIWAIVFKQDSLWLHWITMFI